MIPIQNVLKISLESSYGDIWPALAADNDWHVTSTRTQQRSSYPGKLQVFRWGLMRRDHGTRSSGDILITDQPSVTCAAGAELARVSLNPEFANKMDLVSFVQR